MKKDGGRFREAIGVPVWHRLSMILFFKISNLSENFVMCSFGLVLNTDALCVVRCIHVRELLEVRLSVTPISESISEGDKGARGTYELTRVSVFFRA